MDRQLFGGIVRRARKAKGLTLDVLEAKTRITKGYMSGIENGKINPPSPARLLRIAKNLDLPEQELLLLAYAVKAPKPVRGLPAFVEFSDKILAACRDKKLIP
jgi:transcriptional regulator with XRE-family HTH domain